MSSKNCPTCGELYISQCRCLRGDRTCKNGHHWHSCLAHNCLVKHASDHSKTGCSCFLKDEMISICMHCVEEEVMGNGDLLICRPCLDKGHMSDAWNSRGQCKACQDEFFTKMKELQDQIDERTRWFSEGI
jgi:hypothetical protein